MHADISYKPGHSPISLLGASVSQVVCLYLMQAYIGRMIESFC